MTNLIQYASDDAFWGVSETEGHTLALRAGVIIPAREWPKWFAWAKALFFTIKKEGVKKRTNSVIVNIACAAWLREPLTNIFADD